MNIGYKIYEGEENFNELQIEMALTCNTNGWCMEDGYDEDGKRYLIINPPYEPTLEELKARKISTLKVQRDTLEVEDITVDGNTFDYDEKARERINNAIIALQASGTSIHWTLADHQSTEVTAEDLIKVVSAVAIRSNALHVAYRTAKEKVMEAETIEEVEAIKLEVEGKGD